MTFLEFDTLEQSSPCFQKKVNCIWDNVAPSLISVASLTLGSSHDPAEGPIL